MDLEFLWNIFDITIFSEFMSFLYKKKIRKNIWNFNIDFFNVYMCVKDD